MYSPNEQLDAAHQRLRHVTSDEVNAGAPPQHLHAPSNHHSVWQSLPRGMSSLPSEHPFATRHALSPPPEAYGFSNVVDADNGHVSGSWDIDRHPLHKTAFPPQHHLPTPPLHRRTFHPSFAQLNGLDSLQRGGSHVSCHGHSDLTERSAVPNGLPLSPEDFLPHTRAYLESHSVPVDTNGASIWNIDGLGRGNEGWSSQDQSQQIPDRDTRLPDSLARYGAPSVQHPINQLAPLQVAPPRRAFSNASLQTLIPKYDQSAQLPAIQAWRTDTLSKPVRPSRKLLNAATLRKQEKYRQKADARRNTIAAGMAEKPKQTHRLSPHPDIPRHKSAHAPGAKRRKITAAAAPEEQQVSPLKTATTAYQSPYNDTGHTGAAIDYLQSQSVVHSPPIVEIPLPSVDELPQTIVGEYEEYKWSVYHYQLQPKGYEFAERWFQELFDTTLHAEYTERHFSHVSQGFIKDGNRYSILVLHNAANPFEYAPAPSSTITIGMYGYHWYQHDEIHWTTLATDQRNLFSQCVQAGWLVEKCKWTHDAKPTEKRFHRAYWLSANRHHMRGLLNRGPSDDRPHDLVEERSEEDSDEGFSIRDSDVTNEWDISDAEAALAWRKVQEQIEALGEEFDACGPVWQHLAIASSEW